MACKKPFELGTLGFYAVQKRFATRLTLELDEQFFGFFFGA